MPDAAHYGPEDFMAEFHVSRETISRVTAYIDLLAQWQRKINLIGPKTLPHVWERHVRDSAQILDFIPRNVPRETTKWVDLGTGAGFPGIMLAILGVGHVHLVESSAKKCAFLRNVVRTLELDVTVHQQRIEDMTPLEVDFVTSRALAELPGLMTFAQPFLGPKTEILFLKGQDVEDELTKTTISRNMVVKRHPSRTDDRGVIIHITGAGLEQD